MFRITHNLWVNELRKARVRIGGGLVPVEDTPLKDQSPGVEANIFAAEVLAAVNRLPDAQRACVLLAYVEGYSYQDCASIIDVPIGTIMSRLAAARAKLAPLNETEKAKNG